MPTYAIIGAYQLVFWSLDRSEPIHIHVKRERKIAKFWLEPGVHLASNKGFAGHELRRIQRLVEQEREDIIAFWNEYFAG